MSPGSAQRAFNAADMLRSWLEMGRQRLAELEAAGAAFLEADAQGMDPRLLEYVLTRHDVSLLGRILTAIEQEAARETTDRVMTAVCRRCGEGVER